MGHAAGPAGRPPQASAFWQHYYATPAPVRRPDRDAAPGARVRLPYLPALDGIRGVAVLAVIVYHARPGWLPAGFLGVDIFFVLSGYLITALLLAEWRRSQTIDLPAFWLRRARRLLPALYLLLLVTLAYAAIFKRADLAQLRLDTLAALGYVTNWYLIFRHQSYFQSISDPSLLRNLWSLAVEEQFYLCWPLLVVLGLRGSRRRLLVLSLGGIAASLGLMLALYHPGADPSRVYYGSDTRAFELLVGAALACLWPPGAARRAAQDDRRAPLWRELTGIGLFGGLLLAFRVVHEYDPWLYRGGMALLALATAGLIAVVAHPATCLVARLLALGPLRWLGRRSYAIYLWHWPILMLTRPGIDVPLSGLPLLGLQVAATLAIAELSFRLVEDPVRRGALGRAWHALRADWRGRQRRRLALWAGTGMSASLALVMLGTLTAEARPPRPPAYLAVQAIHSVPAATPAALPIVLRTPTATPKPPASATPTVKPTPLVLPTPERWTVSAATPTIVPAPTPPPTPTPTPTPTPAPVTVPAQLRVTALGDSVMVGAAGALRQVIPNIGIDAVEGRQADELIAVARQLRAEGRLGDVVVVHLGSNGPVTPAQFDTLMQLFKGVPRVIVLNAKVPREWEAPNNAVIARGVARSPNAELLDWHGASSGHPELFYGDGIHLRPTGADFYAHLIAAAIDDG